MQILPNNKDDFGARPLVEEARLVMGKPPKPFAGHGFCDLKKLVGLFVMILSSACQVSPAMAQSNGWDLLLADGGRTEYQIVADLGVNGIEGYAARTLAGYLKAMTGAEFPVVEPAAFILGRPAVFVGLSKPALARLESSPMADLLDQENMVRCVGQDILLYGKGHRASLDASMDFLENTLGWRWYSPFEEPILPKQATLKLKAFSRRGGFDFVSRQLAARFDSDFYLQHRVNMGMETGMFNRGQTVPGELRSWIPSANFVHTSFAFIPPKPDDKYANGFPWVDKHNYFETNPEFFSMDESGKRVSDLQLCYSHRGLRDELTRQVRRLIERSGSRQIIMLDAADRPGRFCHCDGCLLQEKRHQTPGGPLFDYLVELCNTLKAEYPEARVKTLAYRRSQTQIPPRLPRGQRLPDNLIVDFAPIEDCYFADWGHPDPAIQATFQHLKDWVAIAAPGNVWTWMYPNPWGTGHEMPVGNVRRVVTNMRLMHEIGVRGIFLDHHGVNSRSGWSELQAFLVLNLARDIHANVDALIVEFTDHTFGPAAPLMRQYLADLEASRQAMVTLPAGVTYKSRNLDDRTFPYLTPVNIHRWRKWFDEMEAITATLPREWGNVRSQRRELDLAMLWKWFDLRNAWPGDYQDHREVANRVLSANRAKSSAGIVPAWQLGEELVSRLVALIDAGGEKPLPSEFDGIPRERIRTFLPRNNARGEPCRSVPDPEAAFGTAAVVDQPGEPFRCGFSEWKSRVPRMVSHGPRLEISRAQAGQGGFRLYSLGEIELTTDDSLIWLGRSWATNLEIGSQLYFPGEVNRWKAWISLKFTDSSQCREGEEQVLCDRVILVRLSGD